MGRELALLLSLLAVSSCSCAVPQGEATAAAAEAFLDDNAMNLNAMNLNAMNLNAMNLNALTAAALDPAALAQLQDPGPTGDLARQLLRYTVSCALDAGQSFAFTWFDAAGAEHDEVYTGLLGLATSWISGPIGPRPRAWVSACLISRVNYYGTSVMLSSRGIHPALNSTSAAEIAAYTALEGAFWGDLFVTPRVAYACEDPIDEAHARALSRVCAAGWLDDAGTPQPCGMIQRVGACSDVCTPRVGAGGHYPVCGGGDASNAQVVTVYLAP
jgi:hypothetical protein